MTLNVCSLPGLWLLGLSEMRPTQEELWLDRHKHKPLLLCLVHLGKAANIVSSVSELCVPTYIRRTTSLNGVHKKTNALVGKFIGL